ncbi:hypothetical protein KSS87_006414, partial [Heliosperma pusillum]
LRKSLLSSNTPSPLVAAFISKSARSATTASASSAVTNRSS